jgi:hypothetical protein
MKLLICLLVIVWCLPGCGRQEFDPKIDKDGKKICINAIITPDSSWSVSVTRSRAIVNDGPYFEFDDITDASVVVLEDDIPITTLIRKTRPQTLPLDNPPPENAFFVSDKLPAHTPKIGKTYKLMVTAPELGTATSTCVLPMPVQIKRIELDESRPLVKISNEGPYAAPAVPVTVYFDDPPAPGNHYQIAVRFTALDSINRFFYRGTIEIPAVTIDDRLYNPVNPSTTVVPDEQLYRSVSFGDDGINGQSVQVKCFAPIGALYDSPAGHYAFEIVLYTLTTDLYEYLASSDLQASTKQNPLAQPAVVHNNIENGVGVFGGYSKSVIPMK